MKPLTENNFSRILEAVCCHYKIEPSEVTGLSKVRTVSLPRRVAMLICRESGGSLRQIARFFNKCDHSTVHHGLKCIKGFCDVYPEIAKDVQTLREMVKQ